VRVTGWRVVCWVTLLSVCGMGCWRSCKELGFVVYGGMEVEGKMNKRIGKLCVISVLEGRLLSRCGESLLAYSILIDTDQTPSLLFIR
jgi:hypothetical protein